MTAFDYLIVGGGMVADAAARGIREIDAHGSIGILSADTEPPYTRPALTKKLWTDPGFTWDQVPLNTAAETGAELILGAEAAQIDRATHEVATTTGDRIAYRRLLIATGGNPHGSALPAGDRVLYFRSASDYRRLRGLAEQHAHVLVIGGSFIATELAAALVQNGCRTSLVFPEDTLGAKVFPPALAARVEGAFRDAGVTLVPGRRLEGGEQTGDGVHVTLDDGTGLDADAAVLGLGIAPATRPAEEAGLEIDDGIVVDARLRTADPDVWAAGDVARYPDAIFGPTRVEHVDSAQHMGRAAGRSMAGDGAPYEYTPYFYSDVLGLSYEAIGRLDARCETIEDWAEPLERGVVYYLDNDVPVGVLLWNTSADRTDDAREVLRHPPADTHELIGRIPA